LDGLNLRADLLPFTMFFYWFVFTLAD